MASKTSPSVVIKMSEQERASDTSANPTTVSSTSIVSRRFLKNARAMMQLAVFVILMVMFVMNLVRGTPQDHNTSQVLYKMLDMPEMSALIASNNVNRTAN